VLRQVVEEAGVGNGVSKLGDRARALDDGEVRLGKGGRLRENRALRGNVLIDVPSEGLALVETLVGEVFRVGELLLLLENRALPAGGHFCRLSLSLARSDYITRREHLLLGV
jgi:hypothetical protein